MCKNQRKNENCCQPEGVHCCDTNAVERKSCCERKEAPATRCCDGGEKKSCCKKN